jgi:hypothetical protein
LPQEFEFEITGDFDAYYLDAYGNIDTYDQFCSFDADTKFLEVSKLKSMGIVEAKPIPMGNPLIQTWHESDDVRATYLGMTDSRARLAYFRKYKNLLMPR